jgi:hypothetical protein
MTPRTPKSALFLAPEPGPGKSVHFPFVCPDCGHVIGRAVEGTPGSYLYSYLPDLVRLHRIDPNPSLPGWERIDRPRPGEQPSWYGLRGPARRRTGGPLRRAIHRGSVRDDAGNMVPVRVSPGGMRAVEPVFNATCKNCRRRVRVDVVQRTRLHL